MNVHMYIAPCPVKLSFNAPFDHLRISTYCNIMMYVYVIKFITDYHYEVYVLVSW